MNKKYISHLLINLELLEKKGHIDKKLIKEFRKRIKMGKLTKQDNGENHICTYFLPINLKTKSIYLCHHKKANDWIPPGGHIEKGEKPIDTVKREFNEELGYILTDEKVEFMNLSITKINNPKLKCKIHYDLWFLVHINKINFKFCKREFYTASWIDINQALKKIRQKNRIDIEKLKYIYTNLF